MSGHAARNVSAFDLTIARPLAELLEHLASHSDETAGSLADFALILGLCEIVNLAGVGCVLLHMMEFLEKNGSQYGIQPHEWRAEHKN